MFSRGCSGAEVESFLSSYWRPSGVPSHRDPVTEVSGAIKIAIVQDVFEYNVQGERVLLPPCLRVTIDLPLPPSGLIAHNFDAYIQDYPELQRVLSGSGAREETTAAIRTWAIGLLMQEGQSFEKALQDLEKVLRLLIDEGLDFSQTPDALDPATKPLDITQEADRQARTRLIERVPQAAPYLGKLKVTTRV